MANDRCTLPVTVNTGVILYIREHGPSRSAGAIVDDIIIIFLLAGRVSEMTSVFTDREHG